MTKPTDPESDYTGRIQSLMGAAGIVPFSGSLLTGALIPATTIAVGDRRGAVVSAAHGYLPHNSFSRYHRYAWGGLVSVAETERGRGLDNSINARSVVSVLCDLGATHVYELLSATNTPSQRMFEACGLRRQQDLVCGLAMPTDSQRFTR